MGDIKSSFEIAMEKVEKLGEVTEEERLKWKYVPEGERLAARYIKGDCDLVSELSRYDESVKKYVIKGTSDILSRNIGLPKNDAAKRNNKRVMEGLKALKSDRVAVENIFTKIRRVFDYYVEQGEQQRRQAYESLKAEFTTKVQKALQQQLGSAAGMVKVDVTRQPQFQEEWQRLQTKLDLQYTKLLEEYKQELASIS